MPQHEMVRGPGKRNGKDKPPQPFPAAALNFTRQHARTASECLITLIVGLQTGFQSRGNKY